MDGRRLIRFPVKKPARQRDSVAAEIQQATAPKGRIIWNVRWICIVDAELSTDCSNLSQTTLADNLSYRLPLRMTKDHERFLNTPA